MLLYVMNMLYRSFEMMFIVIMKLNYSDGKLYWIEYWLIG